MFLISKVFLSYTIRNNLKMKVLLVILFLYGIVFELKSQDVNDFSLDNTENQRVSYHQLKGEKLTVIDFWATWCKPCLNALPKLGMLSDTLKNQGVQFIGISVDGPRNWSKVKPFTESLGITYPILIDKEGEVMRDMNINAIPTLIVADKNNEIVYIHEGFSPGDENIIRDELEKLLQSGNR